MTIGAALFSSARNSTDKRATDEWETPAEIIFSLQAEFGFTLDAAASDANHLFPRYYTAETDGLAHSWQGERVYVNMPYSQVGKWVEKAYQETHCPDADCLVVLLMPARTDTRIFHRCIWNAQRHEPRPGVEVRFLPGRLRFEIGGVPSVNSAPFPSMVVVMRAVPA